MTKYVQIIRRALPDVVVVAVVDGDKDGDAAPIVVAVVPVDMVVVMVDMAVVVHVGRVGQKRIERLPRHKTHTLIPIIIKLKSGAASMATGLGVMWPMSLLSVPTRHQLTLLLLLLIHQRTPILHPKLLHKLKIPNPDLAS
jgi:hypothetical protein